MFKCNCGKFALMSVNWIPSYFGLKKKRKHYRIHCPFCKKTTPFFENRNAAIENYNDNFRS